MSIYLIAFFATLLITIGLVTTKRWHGRFSMDSATGIQKLHETPTPRIGGIAIALGMIVTWQVGGADVRSIFGPMLVASIPAFAVGMAEDITKTIGVMLRLMATMLSGALAWYLTDIAMQNTGFPPLDWLLRFLPFAVLFTAFAVGGVANAINIIDGLNGLAAGSIAIMAGALGLIAVNLGDSAVASVSFALMACALGFGVVNWPFGKLFLGDGGAYLLGFILAWLAVLLPMRHSQINAWTTIMVCAYPVLEVGFSVRRRRKLLGHQLGKPDRKHLHHFLHRRLVRPKFPNIGATLHNGFTSPLCWLATLLPAVWAVIFAENTLMLVVGLGLSIVAYGAVYARLTQFRWCCSAKTLAPTRPLEKLIVKATS